MEMSVCSPMKRKKKALRMDTFENVLINAAEIIRGRLYFVSLNTNVKPKSTPSVHYFGIDTELNYDSFYLDFGPLNLALLYHYVVKLKRKLSNPALHNKKIVHFTGDDMEKRVNAAYLIGSYAVIYLNFEPEEIYEILIHDSAKEYLEFRDASIGEPYTLSLLNCLKAIKKAYSYGFFDLDNFDFLEYEHYERVENGDFNWIVPNKFIAFCGPHNKSKLDKGYPIHSPETYFAYFRRHKVTTIIRLNKKAYDSNRFVQAGFDHKDLYFVDGGTPSDRILNQFINICESARGAIAVHCKAGLGRTGSLIACYIMKHYKFTAEEAIGWIRICRPGSIIGHQQTWLQEKQKAMWEAGEIYRKRNGMTSPIKHTQGIYSLSDINRNKNNDNVTGIMKKVDCMEINDPEDNFKSEENNITQGDKLNEIKAQRNRGKALGSNLTKPVKVWISSPSTVLRDGKLISPSLKSTGSTSTVDCMEITETEEDIVSEEKIKQTDRLNDIKSQRTRGKQLGGNLTEHKGAKPPKGWLTSSPTVLRGGKLISSTVRTTGSTSTRVFSKRIESKESQVRRAVQRKVLTPPADKILLTEAVKRQVRKKEGSPWLNKNGTLQNGSSITISDDKTVMKRGKRTLALEKDKTSPRSVKVLRRSHCHAKEAEKLDGKLRLPTVKINKTI